MKYKLTEHDYLLLYPLLSPKLIEETFKEQSSSARTIQRLYRNLNLTDTDLAMDELFKRSYAIAETDMNEEEWGIEFMSVISSELCKRIDEIKQRAMRYERLF
jgi:hypothetical protein